MGLKKSVAMGRCICSTNRCFQTSYKSRKVADRKNPNYVLFVKVFRTGRRGADRRAKKSAAHCERALAMKCTAGYLAWVEDIMLKALGCR